MLKRLVIKDAILLPLILIPFILLELIFKKDEDGVISLSIICAGLILIRIFDFMLLGIVLAIFGMILFDSTYSEGKGISEKPSLRQLYAPYVSKYYFMIKSFFNPLRNFGLALKILRIAYAMFLIGMVVYISRFASHGDTLNFVGYLLVSVVTFVLVWYVYYRKK